MFVQFPLSKNIFQTIIYYDILNFPLTSFEVWKYLLAEDKASLGEIVEALDSDELKNSIEEFRGFYFLKSRRDLVARRIQCDKNSAVKFEIAERAARWLKYIPFVRMIAVTGTLAMKNCEKNSDIDFFVILQKGRIFTGRLLVTLTVHLLGKRRYGKKIKNRICLNYFITTDKLEIVRKDLFAANEYSFIYPLFGLDVFQKFCETNNNWIKKKKPNWEVPDLKPARYFVDVGRLQRGVQRFFENLINLLWGDRIESWLKRKQIARIERNPLTQKPGAYIEYTDQNLIFLPVPQGLRIEEEWQRRIKS
jgi:hypothetical protein